MLLLGDVEEELQHYVAISGQVLFVFPNILVTLLKEVVIDIRQRVDFRQVTVEDDFGMDPGNQDVLVVGTVEDPNIPP